MCVCACRRILAIFTRIAKLKRTSPHPWPGQARRTADLQSAVPCVCLFGVFGVCVCVCVCFECCVQRIKGSELSRKSQRISAAFHICTSWRNRFQSPPSQIPDLRPSAGIITTKYFVRSVGCAPPLGLHCPRRNAACKGLGSASKGVAARLETGTTGQCRYHMVCTTATGSAA